MPRFVGQVHFNQDITRENAAFGDRLLTTLDLDDFFGGHKDSAKRRLQGRALDALDQGLVNTLSMPEYTWTTYQRLLIRRPYFQPNSRP